MKDIRRRDPEQEQRLARRRKRPRSRSPSVDGSETSRERPELALAGRGFRALAYTAAGLTFALIIVGGVVRISDSGLGCGAGGQRHEGLAALRRPRGPAHRHEHDRRVLAPDPRGDA